MIPNFFDLSDPTESIPEAMQSGLTSRLCFAQKGKFHAAGFEIREKNGAKAIFRILSAPPQVTSSRFLHFHTSKYDYQETINYKNPSCAYSHF